MRVRYHVAILSPTADMVLVERQGDLWMLPTVAAEDRVRGADVVGGCLSTLGLTARLRWMEPVAFDASSSELQTLTVVDAVHLDCSGPMAPAPIGELNPRQAILEPQALALACCREVLGGDARGNVLPDGQEDRRDFRHAKTWRDLEHWLTHHLAAAGRRCTGAMRQYKVLPTDCVLTIPTATGTVHFKGHAGSPFVEADLGQYLAARWPKHFAETIAYDRERGWLMTARAPGSSLTKGMTLEAAMQVVETLVFLQADACAHIDAIVRLGCPRLDLDRLLREMVNLLDRATDHPHVPLTREMREALTFRTEVAAILADAVSVLTSSAPPSTWLHTDLADSNIFVDRGRVTFIDLAGPFAAPAPIALYSFLHYLPQYVDPQRLAGESWIRRLKQHYADAWSARGWDGAAETFRAAKVVAYAMRTQKGVESNGGEWGRPVRAGNEALGAFVRVRSAARLCQAVMAAQTAQTAQTIRTARTAPTARRAAVSAG